MEFEPDKSNYHTVDLSRPLPLDHRPLEHIHCNAPFFIAP